MRVPSRIAAPEDALAASYTTSISNKPNSALLRKRFFFFFFSSLSFSFHSFSFPPPLLLLLLHHLLLHLEYIFPIFEVGQVSNSLIHPFIRRRECNRHDRVFYYFLLPNMTEAEKERKSEKENVMERRRRKQCSIRKKMKSERVENKHLLTLAYTRTSVNETSSLWKKSTRWKIKDFCMQKLMTCRKKKGGSGVSE